MHINIVKIIGAEANGIDLLSEANLEDEGIYDNGIVIGDTAGDPGFAMQFITAIIKTDSAAKININKNENYDVSTSADAASDLRELFIASLKDIYWAENALLRALPKMAANSTSGSLAAAIKEHILVTQNQVTRLEKIFDFIGASQKLSIMKSPVTGCYMHLLLLWAKMMLPNCCARLWQKKKRLI